jgi:hypothetical protein
MTPGCRRVGLSRCEVPDVVRPCRAGNGVGGGWLFGSGGKGAAGGPGQTGGTGATGGGGPALFGH